MLIHPNVLAKPKTKPPRWLGFTSPPKAFFRGALREEIKISRGHMNVLGYGSDIESLEVLLAPSNRWPSFCFPPRSCSLSSFMVSSMPSIPSDKVSTSLPLSLLSNSIYSDKQTWLEVDVIDICILPGLWSQRLFQILKSCAKYTLYIPPSLLLPYYIKMTCWLPSLLFCFDCGRHFINICISRNYSSEQSELSHVPKSWTQKQVLIPATQYTTWKSAYRREKNKDFKVGQAWVCHSIIINPWVFSFNLLHRVEVI